MPRQALRRPAGCGGTASDDYNGMTKDDLKQSAQSMVGQLQSMSPDQLEEAADYYKEAANGFANLIILLQS